MKHRPWPIVIVAAAQLAAPLVSVALSAWKLKTPFLLFFRLFLRYGTPWQLFNLFGLAVIASLSIWAIKKWSYPVFLGILAWGMIGNYLVWSRNPAVYSLWTLIGVNLVNLAVVSYFLLPAVRAAYFEPKLRWWESKPRFRVTLDADVRWNPPNTPTAQFQQCMIADISEGGVFLRATEPLAVGETVIVSFTIHRRMVSLEGRVVHQGRPESLGYGIQFLASNRDDARAMRDAVRGLELLGYDRNLPQVGLIEDFKTWASTLLPKGEGLVPKISSRSRNVTPIASAKRERGSNDSNEAA